MLSYQTKYHLKSFLKRNYFLVRMIIAVTLISLVFWTIALFNYFDDNSAGTYFENLMAFLTYLIAPITLETFYDNTWTIITSFFTYPSFFQLFADAILILFSGSLFLQYFSSKKMGWCILWSHLAAFIFFILPTSIFPQLNITLLTGNNIGLSGAAYGLLFATMAFKPKFPIPIFKYQVSLQTIAIGLLVLNIATINNYNFLSVSSHIGGALCGFLFGFGYAKRWFPIFGKRKMTYNFGNSTKKPVSDDEYNAKRADEERKINKILDKISKSGYDNLSADEKEFLFNFKRK